MTNTRSHFGAQVWVWANADQNIYYVFMHCFLPADRKEKSKKKKVAFSPLGGT